MSGITPSSAANAGPGQRLANAFAYYLPSLLVILALLVLWQVLVSVLGIKEYILPTPLAALKALGNPNYRWTANLRESVPDARIVDLPGAGHFLFIWRESEVLSEIARFLEVLD